MKKLIIIGGGFAGSYIAKKLETKFKVVLIDTKDYFEFTPGILRTIVEPRHIKKIQVLHSDYLKKTKIILGKVSEVNKGYVKVDDELYKYDYLVICSGSRYNSPIKDYDFIATTRAKNLAEYSLKLKKSKTVLIIGGGLVGVELASEICTAYNDKKVILVHSNKRLINRNNLKSSNYVYRFLIEKNVKIILNQKVISFNKNRFLTDKNYQIKSDIAFLCVGIKPNSEFMKKIFSNKLTKEGYIKVNDFLQLESEKNIFIAGDVNNIKQEKTAQNAVRQAKLIVNNLLLLEQDEKLQGYESKKTPVVISLGKYKGIFEYKNFVMRGVIPAIMKFLIEKIEMRK